MTIMTKILKVTKPFFTLEIGDTLECSNDGKNYVARQEEKFDKSGEDGETFYASFNSSFSISKNYAETLVKDGYLEEVYDKKQNFVNVFDEINNLLAKYTQDYKEVNENTDNLPAVVRLEKMTVLSNLIDVLTHLNNLKK